MATVPDSPAADKRKAPEAPATAPPLTPQQQAPPAPRPEPKAEAKQPPQRPEPKPDRVVRVLLPAVMDYPDTCLIRVTIDGKDDDYWVTGVASDYGLAYRVVKAYMGLTPTEYDCLLENEQDSVCSCPG